MQNDLIQKSIKKIVLKYFDPDNYSIFIFGSRAIGNNQRYSDIDLGIESNKSIAPSVLVALQQDFEESDLPFSVDVVDFSKVSQKFKNIAKQHIIRL